MFNEYKVTGIDNYGKRFSPIMTRSYRYAIGFNLYKGRIWQRTDKGRWNLIREISN